MLERAKAASQAGLDSLFFGDHHVTSTPYYQNTPMLARALAHWHQAPAGALYLLPFRHPVLLAEEIATLASIVPDRFILQCALGYGEREFAAFGINSQHRPSRFEEALHIMQRLWAGETVSHQGRWQIEGAKISPLPPEKIEVWIGAQADSALDRAARLGDAWLASPALTLHQAQQDLKKYWGYCEKYQRRPQVRAIRRDVYVGETQQEAEITAGTIISSGYRGFPTDAPIFGEVESVATAFQSLFEVGFTDIIIRNLVPDQEKALSSIARLADVKTLLQNTSVGQI
ncbi:MAG: LLM class flavin-dependent oxidoreductase [Chloroflexota bacterium]